MNVSGSAGLAVIMCAVALAAQAPAPAGFNGTWSVDGADGIGWTVTLRVNGDSVSGVVSRCANSQAAIYDGRIEGSTVTFKCQNADKSRTLSLVGELHDDTLRFTWQIAISPGGIPVSDSNQLFGRFAPRQFSAKRVTTVALPDLEQVPGSEFAASVNLPAKDIKVEGDLFVPKGVTRVRAILVATGWGRGFAFYDAQEIRRLLTAASCALLLARLTPISSETAGMVAQDERNGGADALREVLSRLATESSHAEVADAPLLFRGHSGGGVFGATFAATDPGRTVAFVGYQGISLAGADVRAVAAIPALVFTDRDNTALDGALGLFWSNGRERSAPWAFVPQPGAPHGDLECLRKSYDLTLPWMSAVLRLRVVTNTRVLAPVDMTSGWLGNTRTHEIAAYAGYQGSKVEASWFPDEASARAWVRVSSMR